MDAHILRQSILETVENFKKNEHVENPFGHKFVVRYLAVINQDIIESYSPVIFEECEWGVVIIYFGEKYGGYVNSGVKLFYILPNKSISDSIYFEGWELKKVVSPDENVFARNETFRKEISLGNKLTDSLKKWLRIYPLIKDCKSKAAVDEVLDIYHKNKETTIEDIIDILVKENSQLKAKLEKIKTLIEE